MDSLPSERKALLFSAGGVRLALRLSQVREILAIAPGLTGGGAGLEVRGESLPVLPLTVPLGLPPGPERFAVITEPAPPLALKVESIEGIVDLASTEVFQLPAETSLPRPAPFAAALVHAGCIALELAVPTLGWIPIEPAAELPGPPHELGFATPREVVFARGTRTFAVPVQLLASVLERPPVFPVPLAPTAHRGLLYRGHAIHPVFDIEVLYGGRPTATAVFVLLVEAGASTIAVLADRILLAGDAGADEPHRPSWEVLLAQA